MKAARKYLAIFFRILIGAFFMFDGATKLDAAWSDLSIISFEIIGLPEFATTTLSFLEFAFGAAVLFRLFTFYFSLALLILMGAVIGMMQYKDVAAISEFPLGQIIQSVQNLSLPANPMVVPGVITGLLVILALLTYTDTREKFKQRQAKRQMRNQSS